MAIKSICEPKMIVTKKLVTRLRRDCIPLVVRKNIGKTPCVFGGRQVAAPTGISGKSALKPTDYYVKTTSFFSKMYVKNASLCFDIFRLFTILF